MSMDWWWLWPVAAFAIGVGGTAWLRGYALRRALLDIPNTRSSHSVPTPRGGGLAIALVVLISIGLLGIAGGLPWPAVWAVLPAAVLVTAVGWLDDHRPLPAWLRALCYLLAAGWFVVRIFSMEAGGGQAATVLPSWWFAPLLVLAIAWLTNLYNFMDGTDGLAGLQAVLAGVAGGFLLWLEGGAGLAWLALAVAAAAGGFLVWNWPPAKIFMGDAGSCLLGFTFGCLAVLGERYAGVPMWLWVILLSVFIWDATLTLIMRVLRGEHWYAAHRSHAYQRLVQLGMSHGRLAWLFLGYNLVILWPLAWWGYQQPDALPFAVLAAAVVTGLAWLAIQRGQFTLTESK